MKLVCISDTHNRQSRKKKRPKIPEGDVLIFAGDMCKIGYKLKDRDDLHLEQMERFNTFLGKQPHKHKLVVAGNHDFYCERHTREQTQEVLSNATYLQDTSVYIEGLTFYGSPWQPTYFNWAFNLRRGQPLQAAWSQIPMCTDVLITHTPPYGILDENDLHESVGCVDLLNKVYAVKPKVHVFGHIHESHGLEKRGDITFVNASSCDEMYKCVNEAVVTEV